MIRRARVQFRRGTAAEWAAKNPILRSGSLGYETDTGKFKFGDGVTPWVDRPYAIEEVAGAPGKSAYEVAVDNGFVGSEEQWLASLRGQDGQDGQDGADGTDGQDGRSAYQIAVDNGFVGDESAWLASLRGQDGTDGQDGADFATVPAPDTADSPGEPGQVAFDAEYLYVCVAANTWLRSELSSWP